MPREGTKSKLVKLIRVNIIIEIRYAPGGDEKINWIFLYVSNASIEIRYAPGGDEKQIWLSVKLLTLIEIRYAPGGDEK